VSFDIFFQRFGGADVPDGVAMAVLEPLVVHRSDGWVRIATGDGEADVYISLPDDSAMMNHASGRVVWDVMYELAVAGRFVVIPGGCGTCVLDEDMRSDLPEGVPEPVITVTSGRDILDLVLQS